jgi:hypothetical protein
LSPLHLCSPSIEADTSASSRRYRIWTVSYKTFFDTLDAVGRSLLRFLHVRPLRRHLTL